MIFRINKTTDYSVISNRHLREKEMSLKAKGLLSVMLGLPDDWKYSINGLVAICKEEESAINSTLKELKIFGYLRVDKLMPNETKSGRIEYIYNIFESPQLQVQKKQGLENQGLEFQGLENQGQLNNNNQCKKNKVNNNIIIAEQVLSYLNEKARTHFKPVESNLKFITARLKDYTQNDLKAVVDRKVKEWYGTEMQTYLRPETLFNATKFESYINGLSKARQKHFANEREYTQADFDAMVTDVDDIDI